MWWHSRPERVYLDYASATPVAPEALEAFTQASQVFGNPGAIHAEGVRAKAALNESREAIAHELGCKARDVVFVSGGTEANNLAILGIARTLLLQNRGDMSKTHWVVSAIEHPSILECFADIERMGGVVAHVDPNENGVITPEAMLQAITNRTVLVSVGWANHEIGIIQPLRDIVRAIRSSHPGVLVHTDAGQAPLYISPQVHTLDVDLLSLDAGKLYGPRGIGALYLSSKAEPKRILFGGNQERGMRPGTENVALAAGFAAAFALIGRERESERARLSVLRTRFIHELTQAVPGVHISGSGHKSLPHIINCSIPDIQSEYITLSLDSRGFAISTKSACREGEEAQSHVVAALGGEAWHAQNTLRISLGRDSREEDMRRFILVLAEILARQKT